MTDLRDYLKDQVLLLDGAMGTQIQQADLHVEKDFWGKENCSEVLNLSRPDFVREVHRKYFAAGSDAVETNTFGGSVVTLEEFELGDKCEEINIKACELAHEAASEFAHDGRPRFVIGSIGPGTKLPSLGHIGYDTLEAGLVPQARGLIKGKADAFLIETAQDVLQMKAAINACRIAMQELDVELPIMAQVTMETTGTMLLGTDMAAAATILHAMGVDVLGLNCATGPQEMASHVKWISENWPRFISVLPNAGLPEMREGKVHFPLSPDQMAKWMERFLKEDGVHVIGGCCGTNEHHIAALDGMLRAQGKDVRPKPYARTQHWVPAVASLYQSVDLRQENAILSIGERCNANGSKKFREAQDAEDWDTCVDMAKEQIREGSHTLDICTAFVGRNEVRDMSEVISRMRGSVTAPLVIDSTEYPVLEAALKLYGGKAIINSINFEDGEEPARKRMELARKFGAGVVALTIDEEGMAKTVERKLEIAKRLYEFACVKHGLPPSDLLIDPLTFTICTGNEDDRKLGEWTLDAIERISKELPDVQIILGLSNISFGLSPAARHVLNSVYLDHAQKRGMTGAIVHVSKIMPLYKIPAQEVKVAEDLIFDRRDGDYDPLQAFIALFDGRQSAAKVEKKRAETVEERLKERIVEGDKKGLEADLDEAMKSYPPLRIINELLLDGMKVVGELFGAGKMQLPFVLQSAETMKKAVAYLEPHMERSEGQSKGKIVLATVKGDVHDIGKNLVDIILTNNGYTVHNLGIKQPVEAVIAAINEHKPDVVGLSGLLVKSTVIMRENLEEMTRQGMDVPVLLGGAALTRAYVEEDCVAAYGTGGRVAYAQDAFDGLDLMKKVVGGEFDTHLADVQAKRAKKAVNSSKSKRRWEDREDKPALLRPVDAEAIATKRSELAKQVEVPAPPFWGARIIDTIPVKALLPFLNDQMLFTFHWGFKKQGKTLDEYWKWVDEEVRPILSRLLKECEASDILQPKAAYGFFPCNADGNALVIFDPESGKEAGRFDLPRQEKDGGICVADFFRDISTGERDVIGLQVVTAGQKVADVAREWFGGDRYQDYLYLHGLGVEIAEAAAEYVHKKIRAELGFGHDDARDVKQLLKQGYRGSRYSFGYPACPYLEDQKLLLSLLGAEKIGITLSEEFQLHPEQSTSAIVVHHPQAKYFNI